MVKRSFKDTLLCRTFLPREGPLDIFTSPIYESSHDGIPLCSPKPAAVLNVQQSNLPSSNCEEATKAASMASAREYAALPSQCSPTQSQQAPDWVPMILEAIPFSVAVLSSDGKKVLYHTCGSEAGAAKLLTKALHMSSSSDSKDTNTCSFLTALLGDLEGRALQMVHGERSCWKGSVSVEFTAGEPPLCPSSCGVPHPSDSPMDPAPSAPAPSASTAHPAQDGQPAGTEMICKALSSPAQLSDDWIFHGEATPSATGPAVHAGAAAAAAAAAAKPRSIGGNLSSETDLMIPDISWKLPPPSWPDPGFAVANQLENTAADHKTAKSFTQSEIKESIHSSSCQQVPGSSFPPGRRSVPGGPVKPRWNHFRRNVSHLSLLMSENSVELFSGTDVSKTKSFLKSLAQQAQALMPESSEEDKAHSPNKGLALSSKAEVDSLMLTDKASSSASLSLAEPALTESTGKDAAESIDVFLGLLKPAHGRRSPILVVTSNNSDRLRVRAALAALAESQLELLSSIMPQHAIQFLALQSAAAVPQHVGQLARAHKGVTLLFMDIVGFTAMSKAVEPQEVMVFLNTLFSLFDQLTNIYYVHKVETAGDCYIASSGIMSCQQFTDGFQVVTEEDIDPALSAKHMMAFAKAMLEVANQVKMPDTHQPVRIRVGLHTGNVVSGLIGSKLPKFSVFGDAMNTASRMESTGVPGRIHVSAATRNLLPNENWEARGLTEVKGKGPMETFLWIPEPAAAPSLPLNLMSLPPTGSLPCVLLKQTQSLLKHTNARNPTSTPQWLSDAPPVVLGGECEPT